MVGTTHLTIELALRARSQGRTETMKTGIRIACWIPILLAIATPAWALEPIGPASEIVLQALRERGDGEPSMEDLVDALNRVTVGFLHAGQYAQAEITVHEALEMGERDLGREHSATLTVLSNLASLYREQGRYDEAEPLYLRTLEARGRILGEDHPDTLTSVNNLAGLYESQGRYSGAEPLYLRALAARERMLGEDHPQTLSSINNLAELYRAQGRYGKAEPLLVRALEAHERILGQDHPNTLQSVNNLALLYYGQGRYGEAEPLLVRALAAYEHKLGQDHPDTLTIQLNLAVVQINRGQRDQALRELRRMDGQLRRFVGNQLATTHRERVRRRWLWSESGFQSVVFSLALQHPGPDSLRLAADVLLGWKRLAGEAEALIARLARSSQDPRVIKTAKALSQHRADLSRLVNLPEPDKEAIAAARAEVERLEVKLAVLSREFQGHLASRTLGWEQVRSALPRDSALLSLRAFQPFDFTTGDLGEHRWLAFLIPADPGDGPELLLKDLGPIAPMAQA